MESLLIISGLLPAEEKYGQKACTVSAESGMEDADLTKRRSQGQMPRNELDFVRAAKETAAEMPLFLGTGYLIYYIKKVPQPQGKAVDFLL